MKFKDIEMSQDQLKDLIKTKANKFYQEFIKNGVTVYRGGNDSGSSIRVVATKKERIPQGRKINRFTTSTIGKLFNAAGISSRVNNTLITITEDPSKIAIYVEKEYYCVPLGDYNYSYVKDITVDFNYLKDKSIIDSINTIQYFNIMGSETSAILEELLLSPISDFDTHYDNLIAHLKDRADSPSNNYDIEDFEEDKERSYALLKTAHYENLKEHFVSNDISKLLGGVVSEVWFNCKSFLLIDPEQYDLEEIFEND